MQFGGFGGIEVVLFLLSKGSELQMIEKIPSTALSKVLQRPQREGRTLYCQWLTQ